LAVQRVIYIDPRQEAVDQPLLPEAGNVALVAQYLEVLAEPRPEGIEVLL
jgi:hypothetical protein